MTHWCCKVTMMKFSVMCSVHCLSFVACILKTKFILRKWMWFSARLVYLYDDYIWFAADLHRVNVGFVGDAWYESVVTRSGGWFWVDEHRDGPVSEQSTAGLPLNATGKICSHRTITKTKASKSVISNFLFATSPNWAQWFIQHFEVLESIGPLQGELWLAAALHSRSQSQLSLKWPHPPKLPRPPCSTQFFIEY